MAFTYINVGTTPNDNTGTTLRAGAQLLNNNFSIIVGALSTDGSVLTINTSSTPSNTYLTSTYPSNTYIIATYPSNTDLHSTFAQNTIVVGLIEDRLQVANAAAQYSTLAQTRDRVQVANASPFASLSFSTNPNYGAAVTYNVLANSTVGFVVSNMGFDKIGNNPQLTVRNQSTVAFALDESLDTANTPFFIKSGASNTNFSNTLIHVSNTGTISTGSAAQGKKTGVLYWQIPHDISSTNANSYQYYSNTAAVMEGNVVVKDTGAI